MALAPLFDNVVAVEINTKLVEQLEMNIHRNGSLCVNSWEPKMGSERVHLHDFAQNRVV